MPSNYPSGGGSGGYPPNPGGGGSTLISEQVVVLLPGDVAAGPDESFLGATFSATGTIASVANPDTTGQYNKFSATSLKTLATGALSAPASETYKFRAAPFTIEAFLYPVSYGTPGGSLSGVWLDTRASGGSDNGVFVAFNSSGNIVVNFGVYSAEPLRVSTGTVDLSEWSHVAIVGYGNGIVSIYINGALDSSFVTGQFPDSGAMNIGQDFQKNNSYAFDGYLNEIRVTKGAAVYSGASFTVPTSALPSAFP